MMPDLMLCWAICPTAMPVTTAVVSAAIKAVFNASTSLVEVVSEVSAEAVSKPSTTSPCWYKPTLTVSRARVVSRTS